MTLPIAERLALQDEKLRCDRRGCPAVARVLTELRQYAQETLALAFCGHDYADLEPLLVLGRWQIAADTRPQLRTRVRGHSV